MDKTQTSLRKLTSFATKRHTILLQNGEKLLSQTRKHLQGYMPIHEDSPDTQSLTPDLVAEEDAATGRWFFRGALVPPETDDPIGIPIGAHLLADLITRIYGLKPSGAILAHGASVLHDNSQLLALIGESMAGKSTLAVHMAMLGATLFGDDRFSLYWDQDQNRATGMAVGMGAKLRLPVYDTASKSYKSFIDNHLGFTRDNIGFLTLPETMLAPAGQSAALGAIILPKRVQGRQQPHIEAAPAAEAMKELLRHSYAPLSSLPQHLKRCKEMTDHVPIYRLTFSNSFEAADLLIHSPITQYKKKR